MLPLPKKTLRRGILLSLVLIFGIFFGFFFNYGFSENARFEKFAEDIFRSEISGNTLTLHYTLARPEKQGITNVSPSLGSVPSDMKKTYKTCETYEQRLKSFSPERLSEENRITLDHLLLHFHTLRSLGDHYLLEEYLSPSLGIQAQLPVLLAEYAFYRKEDIADYLELLPQIKPCFQSILAFEKKKSLSGFFMCDETLNRVQAQCREFIKDPDTNYMQDIFAQKLAACGYIGEKERQNLLTYHEKLLKEQVLPAYQSLIDGLEELRGTGRNSKGLFYFEGGRAYYQYLIRSQTGSFLSVEEIRKWLSSQLISDFKEISVLTQKNPSLFSSLHRLAASLSLSPSQMLETLQRQIEQDFPVLEAPSYELRYVHDSMKDFLSPAFYLTPPADTGSPNVIYLNRAKSTNNLDIFTTLAHEGFPGHLYQTVTFAEQKPPLIRYLFTSGGYVEGWATYIESYACQYAASLSSLPDASDAARLAWLNKSLNLCIYSLLDIGIHYDGWDEARSSAFLRSFGIRSASAAAEIYRYITETPGTYLKYYLGNLYFQKLKHHHMEQLGNNFSPKDFHEKILQIGPVPFPVLEKYMNADLAE